jgi:hypothetical protein
MTPIKAGDGGYYRRHPAEVTSARLLRHYEDWWTRLSGDERDAIGKVRYALDRITEEDKAHVPAARTFSATEEGADR